MDVDVYRNLHRDMWSVRDRSTGRVHAHAEYLSVIAPRFIVQPAGRLKVRETGHKNVHAFVRGELESVKYADPTPTAMRGFNWHQIGYNPHLYDTFMDLTTMTPIYQADQVWLTGNSKIWYKG